MWNGQAAANEAVLDRLQALRDSCASPSPCAPATAAPSKAGRRGAKRHIEGTAFEIAMSNPDPAAFEAAAREAGFLGFGFHPHSDFIRIDLGSKREWGERFPPWPTAFAIETFLAERCPPTTTGQ